MTCLRCEIVRAKIIAMGLAGFRHDAKYIAKDLQGRYGMDYYHKGNKVYRNGENEEEVLIVEARS